MKNKLWIVGLIVIIALCFSACDTGPKEFGKNFPKALRGTWEGTEAYTGGATDYSILIEKQNFTFTVTDKPTGGTNVVVTQKGEIAYGMGPISGPDGDYYIVNAFLTSYTNSASSSSNYTTALNYLAYYFEATVKKDEMKLDTDLDFTGSTPVVKTGLTLKKK